MAADAVTAGFQIERLGRGVNRRGFEIQRKDAGVRGLTDWIRSGGVCEMRGQLLLFV